MAISSGRLRSIGIGIVIVVAVIGLKFYNKGQTDTDAKEAVSTWVIDTPVYEGNEEYIDGLVEKHHHSAFEQCYTIGRRRRSSEFDAQKYVLLVLEGVASDARADGKEDIGAAMDQAMVEARAQFAAAGD